jgi:transcriptional regulator with XRE-family HTH domain
LFLAIAKIQEMKEMSEIRQINFQKAVNSYPSQEAIADILGVTPGYISQLITGHRAMGEKTARKFEKKLKLPINTFDIDSSKEYIEGEFVRVYDESIKENITTDKTLSNLAPIGEHIPEPRPPVIEEEAWKALSPRTRALVEVFVEKSGVGKLKDDDIKLLQDMVDKLSED